MNPNLTHYSFAKRCGKVIPHAAIYGGERMFNELDVGRKRNIANILKAVHSIIPPTYVDTSTISNFEIRSGFHSGVKINRLIVYLRSSGCRWMLDDEFGGCTICGHIAGSTFGKKISDIEYINQFDEIISKFNFAEIPMVCVYNEGSLFNEDEMPSIAREHIFRRLNEISGINHVIFEARPEHLSQENLRVMRRLIPNKGIEIGIGLESSNEYVRQICLNKGFHARDFLKAVELLRIYGVNSLAYVSLKPPFLSERFAIDDSVRTIKWAFNHGINVVSLEPVSVQKFTLIHLLYKMNIYRPPWIWSVFTVVSQVGQLGLVRIGGGEFYPSPFIYTHNCPLCNEAGVNTIESYNSSNDMGVITSFFKDSCSNCKDEWSNQLNDESCIEDLIDTFISSFRNIDLSTLLGDESFML